jgi:hypothetical protein
MRRISKNTLQEMLNNPHEFVSEVGYALGGKSAEYIFGFMKLM